MDRCRRPRILCDDRFCLRYNPEIIRQLRAPGDDAMERRDFLRGAALAGASTALPALASIREPETASRPSLGKIAMEEHFMVPVFMDYFAETYPNISADIAKLAPGALMDFGDRRLAVMDANRVDFVVLSLAGPGVQVEKDAAI